MAKPSKRPPASPAFAKAAPAPAAAATTRPASPGTVNPLWYDLVLGVLLAVLAGYFLNLSWRKWPDPMIDFGRELYLPWRLSQGDVLYRDLQHMYGPFSPYFNSLVFRVGGASLSSLIVSNLIIYAGIVALLYYFVRTGWSRFAAFISCAVFISVFSFSHLVGIGNYNYITPYAHEATQGILIVLLLIWAAQSALRDGRPWKFLSVGLLTGVSVLMKPEIMLAAAAVLGGTFLLCARDRFRALRGSVLVKLLLLVAGGFAPMLLAATAFHLGAGLSWNEALRDVNNAWLNVFTYGGSSLATPMQKFSLGTDDLTGNIEHELIAGGLVLVFAAAAAWGSRELRPWGKGAEIVGAIVLAILALIIAAVLDPQNWQNIGGIIPGLLLCALAIEAVKIWRQPLTDAFDRQTAVRLLLWLAAVAFLFRMLFNPRVFHYGFFQAPLAMTVGLATLLAGIPDFFKVTGFGRKAYQAVFAALICWGAGAIAYRSVQIMSVQTFSVGTGTDQFFALDPQKTGLPSGLIIEAARQYLAHDSGAHSLVVIPEGVMLNYLTRLPSTIPYYEFGGSQQTVHGQDTLQRLQTHPPSRIALVTRDLREYGIARFGDSPDHGSALIDFIRDNYQLAYHEGNDPLDPNTAGLAIYALRPDYSPPAPSPAH